jgi:hypothetical protein
VLVAQGWAPSAIEPDEAPHNLRCIVSGVRAFMYKGDATNQEAIGKHKMFLSTLVQLRVDDFSSDLGSDDAYIALALAPRKRRRADRPPDMVDSDDDELCDRILAPAVASTNKTFCPILQVNAGNSDEVA